MFARYVALGDSQTEGLNDGDEVAGYRGWADRLAERMARLNPDLRYANLAVRGKRAGQIRAEQLDAALALEPDVATVLGGLNDVLRPSFDVAAVVADLEATYEALAAAGARVATATFPDITRIVPVARRLLPRVLDLNAGIREAAARHGVAVADAFGIAATTDRRMWSPDRIHATPLGHERIALAVAHALELPGAGPEWTVPLDPALPSTRRQRAAAEAQWARAFLAPWVGRRIRGRSSGDGRTAKRPALTPVLGAKDRQMDEADSEAQHATVHVE